MNADYFEGKMIVRIFISFALKLTTIRPLISKSSFSSPRIHNLRIKFINRAHYRSILRENFK